MVDRGQLFIGKSEIYENNSEKDEFVNGISIDKFLSITGESAVIDANGFGQIFRLVNGATLFVNNISFAHGAGDIGGAIYVSQGTKLITSYSQFYYNTAHVGAAIYSEGELSITNSKFSENMLIQNLVSLV